MNNTVEDPSRSVRAAHYPGGTDGRRFRWFFPVAVVLIGAVATALIILLLRTDANEKDFQRLLLAQLEAQANRYSALEWQAISEQGVSSGIRKEEQDTDAQVTGLLKQLMRSSPASSTTLQVKRAVETYDSVKDEELGDAPSVERIGHTL